MPYEYPYLNELSITTVMIERDLLGVGVVKGLNPRDFSQFYSAISKS
jgi:hypothetical protein